MDQILSRIEALLPIVRRRAEEHRHTVMMGRTHGVHAEPMTFGLKLALWHAQLQRDLIRLPPPRTRSAGAAFGPRLKLEAAPVSSQVIQRDRHAELLTTLAITAASLETFALEIRGLQKTEMGEVEEPF